MQEEIIEKLKKFPLFRERHLRSDYLSILALRKEHLERKFKTTGILSLKEMARFGARYSSYDRIWRKTLRENKDLRGADYGEEDGTKEILEQEKQIELGYEPNYHQDVRTLKNL